MDHNRQPVVMVPKDLCFGNNNCGRRLRLEENTADVDGYDISLSEDWDSGIGGGLWTTGLALARYFCTSPQFLQQFSQLKASKHKNRPVRVLELGSGNGFLGVCLVTAVAVAASNSSSDDELTSAWPEIEVVVTDTAEHLSLMKTTIESNLRRILPQILEDRRKESVDGTSPCCSIDVEKIASVKEYLWGEAYDFGDDDGSSSSDSSFDLIVGSDVAYRDWLHDPLIAALKEFSRPPPHPPTVALIGVTMDDTKPIFFEKLTREGFRYEKLADHLFDTEFVTGSRQFGIFVISRMK